MEGGRPKRILNPPRIRPTSICVWTIRAPPAHSLSLPVLLTHLLPVQPLEPWLLEAGTTPASLNSAPSTRPGDRPVVAKE